MKNILLLFSFVLLISSCERSTSGCTEPAAVNYNINADYDNGSCVFQADVVFFYNAWTANELNAADFDRLDFYIEGDPGSYEFVGSEDPTFIYGGIPNCYEDTYVTATMQWEDSYSTNANYLVYGITYVNILGLTTEVETLVDEYSFDLYANECAAVPIRFLTFQATNANK